MEELFVDLQAYGKDKKWMWFELFIRQPMGLRNLVYFIVSVFLVGNHGVRTWGMVIILIVWVVLALMTLARKRYSYSSWIALLVLQTVVNLMNREISFLSAVTQEIILVLLILYYSKRKDFFYKEASDAEPGVKSRRWEIELVILIHLIFASCLHWSLGSVLKIGSMTVYENEMLAMLGWFLYGGGLYLAFRWEKITRQSWRRIVLNAAGTGIAVAAARTVLDYYLDGMLLDGWNYRGIMRTSLLITGAFCLILIRIFFIIFAKRRKRPLDEAWIPMAAMAVIAISYLAEYVFSCGWVSYDQYYARQGVLPLYVWSISYFLMLFWVVLRMKCVNKGEEDGPVKRILKKIAEHVMKYERSILVIALAALLTAGIVSFNPQRIKPPIWMTYPYKVTLEDGEAVINAYIAREGELNVPLTIWGVRVKRIDDDAFKNTNVHITAVNIPEECEFNGDVFHYESQSYYSLGENTAWISKYIGEKKEVKIPEEVWGRKVTGIYAWCFQESDIEKVTIPDTVVFIDSMAFEGCRELTKVRLSLNLEEIAVGVFEGTGIRRIIIPASVKTIGKDAFKNSLLEEVIGLKNVENVDRSAFNGTPWKQEQEEKQKE